jgi:hypothetical protein
MLSHFERNAGVLIVCLLAMLAPAVCADSSASLLQAPAHRAGSAAALDGIAAIQEENGRKVYVNAPPVHENQLKRGAKSSRRASVLVYWSNTEHLWKPVPPPTPSAMRAARSAAAEVEKAVASRQSPAASVPVLTSGCPISARALCAQKWDAKCSSGDCRIEIDDVIEKAAARNHVDPNLVRAVIKVESNFNPHAISPKGAMGLMQLMPATARTLNVNNPFDPQENVDGGVRHLRGLLDDFGGDVELSLAAYNAGEGAVLRHGGVPDYPETRNYVRQITNFYGSGTAMRGWTPRGLAAPAFSAPIQMIRGPDGVLTISNE